MTKTNVGSGADPLLTPDEVQAQLHISAATLRNWVNTGKITYIPLPSRTRKPRKRFRQSEVTRLKIVL